jgi:hypothetical protein
VGDVYIEVGVEGTPRPGSSRANATMIAGNTTNGLLKFFINYL